ncbi:ATP-dependent helicase [Paenibacillus vini]|uniref:ATP-dependent helicase n=1 Tax=Paenibacillus vini TaxID=1476024 RepID=UPI0025B70F05|nr:ATP-dependent helicase [Paenibacillus vini]MDN4067586.1 ATP-dependent helicase [Paenibacillus vini]
MKDCKELREEITTLPVNQSVIVAAGPGSGKTKLLVDRFIYLCKNSCKPNSNIACITYTNAAKNEILDRLQKDNKFSLPQGTFIGTIHSFLNEYLIAPYSYLLSDVGQSYELLPRGFSKYYVNRISNSRKFKIYDNLIALESIGYDKNGELKCFRTNRVTKDEMALLKKLIHEDHKIDQQDTIHFAFQLLINFQHLKDALTSRFSAILVDEYQDVTYHQDQIFQLLNSTSFFFVGDPNQSIFSFTGADPTIFESRLSSPETFRKYTLSNNFRSTRTIVDFNNNKSTLKQLANGSNSDIHQEVILLKEKSDIKEAIEAFHEIRIGVDSEEDQIPFLILARKHEMLIDIQQKISGHEIEQSPFLKRLKEIDFRRYEIINQLLKAVLLNKFHEYGKSIEAVELALARVIFNKNPKFISLSDIKYDPLLWRKLQVGIFAWLNTQEFDGMSIESFLKVLKDSIKNFSEKNLGIKIGVKLKILDYEWPSQKKESKKITVKQIMKQIILDPTEAEKAYLSTIHSAKGREATSILVIAEDLNELKKWLNLNDKEEARVGFVAFTRARRLLCVWCPGLTEVEKVLLLS